MTINELIEAANNVVIGPKEIAELRARLEEDEKVFEELARKRMPTTEMLNRQYTI